MKPRQVLCCLCLEACAPLANPEALDSGMAVVTPSWSATEVLAPPEERPRGGFGDALANGGDLNGDGLDTLVIGAYHDSERAERGGAVWLVELDALEEATELFSPQVQEAGKFGEALLGAGDLDGDGYDDLLVTAPGEDEGLDGAGVAYLFGGSSAGLLDSEPVRLRSSEPALDAGFGQSLVALGDVDGDGFDDLALGDAFSESSGAGAVELFWGGVELEQERLVPDGLDAGDHFGSLLPGAADIDGDGVLDLLFSGGSGQQEVWFWSSPGRSPVPSVARVDLMLPETDPGSWMADPALLVDLDGDGHSDLITSGLVGVFTGGADGPDPGGAHVWVDGDLAQSTAVTDVGDLDEDGLHDIVFANSTASTDALGHTGRAWLLLGGTPEAWSPELELLALEDLPTACWGTAVARVGDQVVVGDRCAEGQEGRVHLLPIDVFSGS